MTRVPARQRVLDSSTKATDSCPLPQPTPGLGFWGEATVPHSPHNQPQGHTHWTKLSILSQLTPVNPESPTPVPPPRAKTLPKSQGQILAQCHEHNYTQSQHTTLLFHTPNQETRAYKALPAPHKPPAPQPLPAMPRSDRPRTADLCARQKPPPHPLRARARAHTQTHTQI